MDFISSVVDVFTQRSKRHRQPSSSLDEVDKSYQMMAGESKKRLDSYSSVASDSTMVSMTSSSSESTPDISPPLDLADTPPPIPNTSTWRRHPFKAALRSLSTSLSTSTATTASPTTKCLRLRLYELNPANWFCVDCDHFEPTFINLALGALLCERCVQIHADFGFLFPDGGFRQIQDTSPEQVEAMLMLVQVAGNQFLRTQFGAGRVPYSGTTVSEEGTETEPETNRFALHGWFLQKYKAQLIRSVVGTVQHQVQLQQRLKAGYHAAYSDQLRP